MVKRKVKILKRLLLFVFLVTGINLQSQVLISLILGDKLNSDRLDFGLEGGGNFSSVIGLDTKKYVSDWNLGFYFVYRLKKDAGSPWYVNTGVLVKAKTGAGKLTEKDLDFLDIRFKSDSALNNGDYYQKVNAFLVPAMLRYKWNSGIYLEGGLQASLRYKAWVEYKGETDDGTMVLKKDNEDMINPIDVGVVGGVGYRLKKRTGMTFGVKYYYGFANVYHGVPGTRNSVLFLKLNIPIGAGEKAQAKRARKAKERAAKKASKQLKH